LVAALFKARDALGEIFHDPLQTCQRTIFEDHAALN
jgi:hypothetical protein